MVRTSDSDPGAGGGGGGGGGEKKKKFLGSGSTKKSNHDCDQALIKKQLGICI